MSHTVTCQACGSSIDAEHVLDRDIAELTQAVRDYNLRLDTAESRWAELHNRAVGNISARIAALENGGEGIPLEGLRRALDLRLASLAGRVGEAERRLTSLDDGKSGQVRACRRDIAGLNVRLAAIEQHFWPRMLPDTPALRPETV